MQQTVKKCCQLQISIAELVLVNDQRSTRGGGGDTQDYIGVPLPLLFVLLPFILKSFFQKGILSPSPYFSTSSPPELIYANT